MNTTEAARRLKVDTRSIQNWVSEFGAHFSQQVQNASAGETLIFTDRDAAVLATIADMERRQLSRFRIYATLESDKLTELPEADRNEHEDIYQMTTTGIQLERHFQLRDEFIKQLIEALHEERRQNRQQISHILCLQDALNKLQRNLGQMEGENFQLKQALAYLQWALGESSNTRRRWPWG